MLFPKRLVYTLQDLWYPFYILSKTDRSEVQNDSKEGYLTLWCHQPHPGQSLNPQTVVEFGDQEVEWGWIFQRVFMWVPGHVGIRGNKAADRAAKKKSC